MSNANDFVIKKGVLEKYNGRDAAVVIPDGVTTIGASAFFDCKSLTAVTIPDSVTTIGNEAFKSCENLTAVTIPDSVTTISHSAFSDCESLTAVTIPNSVMTIGNYAFFRCWSLSAVTIPASVTTIGEAAFYGCSDLTAVTIPNSVTTIGEAAFFCSGLTDITIPDSVTAIGEDAFSHCESLTTITIPNSITTIGDSTFRDCKRLTAVTIPDSVTTIGDLAFYGCDGLTTVTIPDSVTTIGYGAFSGCKNLSGIWVNDSNKSYSIDNHGTLFNKNKTLLILVPGTIKKYTVSSSVTAIDHAAFLDCASLTAVTIPDSVTTIGNSTFRDCKRLTAITIPDGVTTIGCRAFYDCKRLTAVTIPDSVTTIGDEAFCGCERLKKLTLGVSTGKFVTKHFSDFDKLRIDIPDISALPAKFRICAALCFAEDGGDSTDPRFESHAKYLKANSGKIIEAAVQNLPLLVLLCREGWIKAKDIEAYADAVQKTGDAEKIAMILDYQNNKLTTKQKENAVKQQEKQENTVLERAIARMDQVGIAGLHFVVTGNVETFANRSELKAFIESRGGKLQSSMSSKTDYLIMNDPDSDTEKKKKAEALGIEVITEYQFNEKADRAFIIENGTLTKYQGTGGNMIIPDSVTTIGDSAFDGCESLTSVTIPDSVTTIGHWAFDGCKSLTIRGKSGSYAEKYAKKCKIPFVAE